MPPERFALRLSRNVERSDSVEKIDSRGAGMNPAGGALLGAVFNLNHPAHVVHWHFISLSLSNVIVMALMLVVFALAIVLPFPGAARRRGGVS
jgi:hypothetical protein